MAGSDVTNVPPGGVDALIRRIEALEQWKREMIPSVARTVSEMVAGSVTFATGWTASEGGFSVPSGGIGPTSIASLSIAVPEGYEYAGLIATGYVTAENTTGSEQLLQAAIEVGAWGGGFSEVYVPAGATLPITTVRVAETAVDTTVNLFLKIGSTVSWSATPTNRATLSALVTFRKTAP